MLAGKVKFTRNELAGKGNFTGNELAGKVNFTRNELAGKVNFMERACQQSKFYWGACLPAKATL